MEIVDYPATCAALDTSYLSHWGRDFLLKIFEERKVPTTGIEGPSRVRKIQLVNRYEEISQLEGLVNTMLRTLNSDKESMRKLLRDLRARRCFAGHSLSPGGRVRVDREASQMLGERADVNLVDYIVELGLKITYKPLEIECLREILRLRRENASPLEKTEQ